MNRLRSPGGRQRRGQRAMALVVTLAVLTILTVVLLAYVSATSLDRSATKSYAQSLKVEQVALGGLDQLVSQLQAQIKDPQLSTNLTSNDGSNPLYIPLAASNAVPQRVAVNAVNQPNLLTFSGTNPFTAGAGSTNLSSASSTQSKSMNGRSIPAIRWNKALLSTNTTGFPTPQWILMTRGGPRPFATYSTNMADGAVPNEDFIVGRYSYVVYDTSGLLDANVAGYPNGAGTNAAAKGLLPWADLTQLASGILQGDVDNFVNWRNAATSTNYTAGVRSAARDNGFTRIAKGDTGFLGRQDLIKYVQTQNPNLTAALPYLTTFSREINGATWGPSNPAGSTTNYALMQYTTGALNPRIPNPRVTAPFTRNNGLPAVVGEPLVKYRFPLDKLALLEKASGSSSLTANDVLEIQKYFGLDLAADANGPSFRHWTYPTSNPVYKHGVLSGASGIMTLDDVALQNREPDFFELLQAGILAGSLGVPGKNAAGTGNPGRGDQRPVSTNGLPTFVDPDTSTTLQTLRIGANIIDQWDADNFPTTITHSLTSLSVYGIEDLPYPFAAFLNIYAATPNVPPFNFYVYFELWNPHQISSASAGTATPKQFRLSPQHVATLADDSDYFWPGFRTQTPKFGGGTNNPTWRYNGSTVLSRQFFGPANVLTFSINSGDYREPSLIPGTTAGAPSPLSSIACFEPPPLSTFPPLNTLSNGGTPNVKFPSAPETYTWTIDVVMSLVMRIQYLDAGGNWRTYGTFVGMDDPAGSYSSGTGHLINGIMRISSTPSLNALSAVKSDPRTFRLGAGGNFFNWPAKANANLPLSTAAGVMNNPVDAVAPFGTAGLGMNTPYRLDMWAANDPAISVPSPNSGSPYYADVDGVKRWGDARNSYRLQNASPLFAGEMANRPVILNRPFTSVGDLGYVFRDMAWKTLDLFSDKSADSGLLDLFTLSEAPVLAGRVNPNTPYPEVLAALIAGGAKDSNGTTVNSTQAQAVAKAIRTTTATAPFVNRSDLVNRFMTNSAVDTLAPSGIKTEAEAAIRALAESANTRTWNLLIDIIAESGRYPLNAKNLDNFVVEGQRRYWLHIAIDRYTGQIVDKQLELVTE